MKYYLKHKKTGRYLRGYKGNKPLWSSAFHIGCCFSVLEVWIQKEEASSYSEEDALRLQKRLECQSQPVELIEKIE